MIKAVIVKNNKVIRIVVTKNIEQILLGELETAYECSKDKTYKIGDTFDGVFTRMLKFVGIK